jgi:hypothetical protein
MYRCVGDSFYTLLVSRFVIHSARRPDGSRKEWIISNIVARMPGNQYPLG